MRVSCWKMVAWKNRTCQFLCQFVHRKDTPNLLILPTEVLTKEMTLMEAPEYMAWFSTKLLGHRLRPCVPRWNAHGILTWFAGNEYRLYHIVYLYIYIILYAMMIIDSIFWMCLYIVKPIETKRLRDNKGFGSSLESLQTSSCGMLWKRLIFYIWYFTYIYIYMACMSMHPYIRPIYSVPSHGNFQKWSSCVCVYIYIYTYAWVSVVFLCLSGASSWFQQHVEKSVDWFKTYLWTGDEHADLLTFISEVVSAARLFALHAVALPACLNFLRMSCVLGGL